MHTTVLVLEIFDKERKNTIHAPLLLNKVAIPGIHVKNKSQFSSMVSSWGEGAH